MTTLKETVESLVSRECTELGDGTVQIHTEHFYPDRDLIDIYVQSKPNNYKVTDLGDTYGWLFVQGIEKADIKTALNSLDPKVYMLLDGAIVTFVDDLDSELKETVRNMALEIRKICYAHSRYKGDSE